MKTQPMHFNGGTLDDSFRRLLKLAQAMGLPEPAPMIPETQKEPLLPPLPNRASVPLENEIAPPAPSVEESPKKPVLRIDDMWV